MVQSAGPGLYAQDYAGLIELSGAPIRTLYSPGHEVRAAQIAERCEKARTYMDGLVHFTPVASEPSSGSGKR